MSVSVVVVSYNVRDHLVRCLEAVVDRGHEVVVVDNASTDGTPELVRERFPSVRLVELPENRGFGAGNNAGMEVAGGDWFLLLNADAWPVDDAVERLAAFGDEHPEAAVVGPRLRNPDGSLQRSVRGFPTLWRLATEYLFLRKLAPRTRALNAFYGARFDHESVREADWLYGACLLVRRAATQEVGLFDEDFFLFSEETDWCYRFREAGWKVLFYPGAEIVHVGGASHGGRDVPGENVRGHLRFLAKHHGPREAEQARRGSSRGRRVAPPFTAASAEDVPRRGRLVAVGRRRGARAHGRVSAVRVMFFGTYDARRHPRVAVLRDGLKALGVDVVEANVPLGLDTAWRVRILRRPWLLPLFAVHLFAGWARLWRLARRTVTPDAVVVGYMGHLDVLLARRLWRRRPIVLDHLVFASDTAADRRVEAGMRTRALARLDRAALAAADVIVLDTDEHLALLSGADRERAVVIPVGAREEWFHEPEARPGPTLRVIFFGLYTPLQGTPVIGRAIARPRASRSSLR